VALDRALARGGLSLADVDLKEVPFPDMLPALANRSLDAAISIEPFLSVGQGRGVFGVFHGLGDFYPDQQIAVLLYAPQFAAQPDVAGRFMVAYLRGLRAFDDAFFRDVGRDEVVDTLARRQLALRVLRFETLGTSSLLRLGDATLELLEFLTHGHGGK
jgi:NitT/TauT family transport system substrate-binding protein